jgi:hypothetical protein
MFGRSSFRMVYKYQSIDGRDVRAKQQVSSSK